MSRHDPARSAEDDADEEGVAPTPLGNEPFSKPAGSLTCPRCGTFVHGLLDPPISVCHPCAEKLLPAPLRGPLTLGGIAHGTTLVFQRAGLPCVLLSLAFALPGDLFFAFVPEAPFQVQTLYGLVTLIADLGVMVLSYEAIFGRAISVPAALSQGLPRYGAVFGARFRAGLLTLLWSVLFILPGIYKGVSYSLAASVALFEPRNASRATDVSVGRTDGLVFLIAVAQAPLFFLAVGGPLVVWLALNAYVGSAQTELSETFVTVLSVALSVFATLVLTLLTIVEQVVYAKTAIDAELSHEREPPTSPRRPIDPLDAELARD